MKKLLLLTSALLLLLIAPIHVQDANAQIEQLRTEISQKHAEIRELQQSQTDADTVEFEHEGLKFAVQIEVKPFEGEQDFEDTDVLLHLSIENTTDTATAFDPEDFRLTLAGVEQIGVHNLELSMDKQAIPGKTTVEGIRLFNMTEAASNDKDLTVQYIPNYYQNSEVVFEFKLNDYKHVGSSEESAEAEQPVETEVVEVPTETPVENYSEPVEEFPDNSIGVYNPQGEPTEYIEVEPEYYDYIHVEEGTQEAFDMIESAYEAQYSDTYE